MKSLYYNREGRPMEMLEWARKFEKEDRRIAVAHLWWGGRVSTVFLGLDHSFLHGPPLIFETMVFAPRSWSDLDMNRYTTEEQAKAGHIKMVRRWQNPFVVVWALLKVLKYKLSRLTARK